MWCFRLIAIGCLAAGFSSGQTSDPAEQAQRASELVAQGKADEAAAIYARLVEEYPGRPELLLNLCIAEFKAKRYQQAITHASDALKLNPNLAPADLFLGASYLQSGQTALAVEPLQKAVAAMPADHNAHLMLGDALLGSKRLEEALQQFQQTSKLLPQSPKAWYGLGEVYDQLFETCRSQLHETAPVPAGTEAAAVSYVKCKSYSEQAAQAYENLLALPPSLESHLYAAKKLDAQGRYREAAAEWRTTMELAPGNIEAEMGLAWALYRRRDYEPAMAVLKRILERDPLGAEANFLYGASLLNMEQPDAAIPYLQTALKRDPELRVADAALGQALLRTGKPREAIPYLRAAIPNDEDGNAAYQLFRAYQETGATELAKQALAEYQTRRASALEKRAAGDRSGVRVPGN